MELKFGSKTFIMGIINVTPDSFYDGGRNFDKNAAVNRIYELCEEGADIIDIGGESTRPGADELSVSEELDRVCPVIQTVAENIEIPISIDTYKSEVAEEALKLGAAIVNDISGLNFDKNMAAVASKYNAYVVLMHIKGTPKNMQTDPKYDNLLGEISSYLNDSVQKALDAGVDRGKIILDPGIGFGKTLEDNYRIIENTAFFKDLGFPLLIGLSRKSLIGKLLEKDDDRLYATIALNSISAAYGADIIRVHDVKEHYLAFKSVEMLKGIEASHSRAVGNSQRRLNLY
ncbi:MAG: dihydropteroate synthase [Spirochaetes bacterium]|nr:dihydropteroate synthase [Spirochaetota bacterium]